MDLFCANPTCLDGAGTIWRGYALCDHCHTVALEVPDGQSPERMMAALVRVAHRREDGAEDADAALMRQVLADMVTEEEVG